MHTAQEIRKLDGFTGDARLYRLSQPVKFDGGETDYVAVSATMAMFSGPETYIFPTDKNGTVISWSELDGSFKGGLSHAEALHGAGYEVQSC